MGNQNQKTNKNNQNQKTNKNNQNQKKNQKNKINKAWTPSLTHSVMSVCDEIPPHSAAPRDSSIPRVSSEPPASGNWRGILGALLAITIIVALCFWGIRTAPKKSSAPKKRGIISGVNPSEDSDAAESEDSSMISRI